MFSSHCNQTDILPKNTANDICLITLWSNFKGLMWKYFTCLNGILMWWKQFSTFMSKLNMNCEYLSQRSAFAVYVAKAKRSLFSVKKKKKKNQINVCSQADPVTAGVQTGDDESIIRIRIVVLWRYLWLFLLGDISFDNNYRQCW